MFRQQNKQMKRYTISEIQIIDKLLQTVPRGVDGTLPFSSWIGKPEWSALLINKTEESLKAMMNRRWAKSVLPVQPTTKNESLNHAFNFCPSCGFKLN